MPGAKYLGKCRETQRVSPDCRRLADALLPLEAAESAATALLDAVSSLSKSQTKVFQANLEYSIDKMRQRGWDRGYQPIHEELSSAAENALHRSFGSNPKKPTKRFDQSSLAVFNRPQMTIDTASQTEMMNTAVSLTTTVSDSEDGAVVINKEEPDEEFVRLNFWCQLVEAVQLQVCARGLRNRPFAVYQLAGPVMSNLDQVRSKISKSFLSQYTGKGRSHGECRVYQTRNNDKIWIQLNLGHVGDSAVDFKLPGDNARFVVVLVPDSALAAVSGTHSRLTKFVLSALEHALTCSVIAHGDDIHNFGNLRGLNPHELLKTAQDLEAKQAIGRYRRYDAKGKRLDPVEELKEAATGSLMCRKASARRICEGDAVGRQIAQHAHCLRLETKGHASLVGEGKKCSLVEHDAKRNENRKRLRESATGAAGDCPVRKRVLWEFEGQTAANSTCWDSLQGRDPKTVSIKCRVVMKGSDVFGGIQDLIEKGYMDSVPYHVQEAPSLGTSIQVCDGTVSTTKDATASDVKGLARSFVDT